MFNNQSKNHTPNQKKCIVSANPKKDAPKVIEPQKNVTKFDSTKDERIKN